MQVRIDDLLEYEPLTNNQARAYESWDEGDNLILTGSAGTVKLLWECILDLNVFLMLNHYRIG